MAMAEMEAPAQHFPPPSSLPLQEEDKTPGPTQPNSVDGIPDGGWEEVVGCDTRNVYPGNLAENGQAMYYNPAYGFPHPPSYHSQPQGPYASNVGPLTHANGPQQNVYYYQQPPPPSGMHYYPNEQEGLKLGIKKVTLKDVGQNQKAKSGVNANNKQGYQGNPRNLAPSEACNQWGYYPGMGNGNYYGSLNGYDYYSQQWHSSAQGFQPIPPPQNLGLHGNCIPPIPNGGLGQYQGFPNNVHFAQNHNARVYKGTPIKGGIITTNWRAKETSKNTNKVEQPSNNLLNEVSGEDQGNKSLLLKSNPFPPMVQRCHSVADQTSGIQINESPALNRSDYNKEDFQVSYESAKFFVIKSYSEDDVHKSIKYSVWSSTPNGNKRLDEAYHKAQEKSDSASSTCPVFFFFSVNCSGQFCGVAEMTGSVDFSKNMDFWLQGKWNGCLPVKWHIIKDVPNGHFRHITLANNENKPVTHSRDTQEVHFHQGLEMLKIFKFFPTRTSLLDDFAFYDSRQKVLQERKSKQQQRLQVVRQTKDQAFARNGGNIAAEAVHVQVKEKERVTEEAEGEGQVEGNGVVVIAKEAEGNVKVETIESRIAGLKVNDNASCGTGDGSNCNSEECASVEKDGEKEAAKTEPKGSSSIAIVDKACNKMLNGVEEKGGKPKKVVNPEAQAKAGKDETISSVPINYKKALLEGIPGKVNMPDQAIGA